MNFKRLYLHDDHVQDVITATTVSVKLDDDTPAKIKGQQIGQITVRAHGWIEPEVEQALRECTSVICADIHKRFMALDAFKEWRPHPDNLKIRMANDTIYLLITRPIDMPKITFTQTEIATVWPDTINEQQKTYTLRGGHILSGGPEGGTIQYSYSLRDFD